ncbi:unnamed protein product [Cuscuta epithymum]|uniref:GRIP domain-containing protein n=1 Tax=Cuscuta epithymum TaxID=186058 RepID=A0AAV0DGP0_9ASTE|nr:unnamed protein product [Cuscuta epithymum]
MSMEGGDNHNDSENHIKNAMEFENQHGGINDKDNSGLTKESDLHYSDQFTSDSNDDFIQMVVELNFQNEYLKYQILGLKHAHSHHIPSQLNNIVEHEVVSNADTREFHEKMEHLEKQLLEERQTRSAAEEAVKHLQTVYLEADRKVQVLSNTLAEAQQKMEQELKDRDEKYSELDSKFTRLHKRAKQRIQDVQKEKEDIEAQFRDVNEKAESASSQLSALQQELERSRQQAQEALKTMDVERQQLRSANNKLRDSIEELRRSLAPKENALEDLQQSLVEKDQMLENMRGLLKAADEKRLASLSELSSKHQQEIENLEAQIRDALAERSKTVETISSLRATVAEKESKIAEVEAASSGEAARLRASMETVKGELLHLKSEHGKEKESWEATTQSLRTKLEVAESNCIRSEIEAAKMRSKLESELSAQSQLLNSKDAELVSAEEKISRLESEFTSYKVRAHALLQKKDAELAATRDNEQVRALEESLKEIENELLLVCTERDKTLEELKESLAYNQKELAERDAALITAEKQIRSLESELNSALSAHQREKEMWDINLQNVEETWRLRCDALKVQKEVTLSENMQKELHDLKLIHKKLKDEHDTFRDLADKMIEEKDEEISRLLDEIKHIRHSLSKQVTDQNSNYDTAYEKREAANTSAAEHQILILARQQAQREEELAQSQRHILALQEEIEELERENRLHSQQVSMLKDELRNMDRSQKREGVDLTYLKNVILKLLETGEVEALLPVIAMLLQFSPDEMLKCQQSYRSTTNVPVSPASDSSGTGLSLLSRFSFS